MALSLVRDAAVPLPGHVPPCMGNLSHAERRPALHQQVVVWLAPLPCPALTVTHSGTCRCSAPCSQGTRPTSTA